MALALTSRRNTTAAVASALLAMALAAAVAGRSCRVSEPGPEVVVRDMLRAAKAGDREVVYTLLAPATPAAARRARVTAGRAPIELIKIDSRWRIDLPAYGRTD